MKHPVIHIDFSGITYSEGKENFKKNLKNYIIKIASEYNIRCSKRNNLKETFEDKIYIIKFKLGNATKALKQIKDRKYYERFLNVWKENNFAMSRFKDKEVDYATEVSAIKSLRARA